MWVAPPIVLPRLIVCTSCYIALLFFQCALSPSHPRLALPSPRRTLRLVWVAMVEFKFPAWYTYVFFLSSMLAYTHHTIC